MRLSIPLTAPLEDGESLHGYLLRLSGENLYSSISVVPNALGLNVRGASGLVKLANYSEVLEPCLHTSADKLKEKGYQSDKSSKGSILGFGEQKLDRELVDLSKSKLCPQCLKEEPYHKQVWDLVGYTHCPKHHCALIGVCPTCGRKLSWSRTTLCHCRCGEELSSVEPNFVNSAPLSLLMSALESSSGVAISKNLPEPFASMAKLDVVDFHKVISLLGAVLLKLDSRKSSRLAGLSLEGCAGLMEEAAMLLDNWPYNFWNQIDVYRAHLLSSKKKSAGLQGAFGALYKGLYGTEYSVSLQLFRDTFKDYLRDRGYDQTVKHQGCTSVWGTGRQKETLSREETGKFLQVGPKKIQWLEEIGILKPVTLESNEKKYRNYTAENVAQAKSYLSSLISLDQLCRIIGVSRQVGDDLAAQGLLKAARGPNVDGNRNWVFTPTAPQTFLDSLANKAISSKGISSQDLVSLNEAFSGLRQYGVSHLDAIMMVLGGELSVYLQRDPPKVLGDILVRKGDLSVQGILQMKSGIRSLVTT
ncbi:hypothetical protein WH95_06220 [Kiloniella litopenaei]|uniref:TniQ domain-containing protein n=1 Tax=Kiloniella litopenaei TaxID=1549748 RepID=A0A0M2R8I7_9PROT|nr:TniQ family protein [Kiloniella litopenaei]KKJ77996.1 hypothetical protein WH95_06220 [Kiloniella litopenaei]